MVHPQLPSGWSLAPYTAVSETAAFDKKIGIISITMWFGTAVRVFPMLSPAENFQSIMAMVLSECLQS